MIIHGLVLAQDAADGPYLLQDGGLAIRDGLIVEIGKSRDLQARYAPDELIDAADGLVLPGLVDGHVHTMQTLARGLCDLDHPDRRAAAIPGDPMGNAATWAQNAWLFDAGLDEDDARLSAQLAIIEMLKSGTTTYADVCAFNVDTLAEVVGESGIRAVLAKNTSDRRDLGMPLPPPMVREPQLEIADSVAFHERWNGAFGGRLTIWFGLHALWACSDALCRGIAEAAKSCGTGISMHLTQTEGEIDYARTQRGGARPVALMEELGVLDSPFVAIHSAYLDEEDIRRYTAHDVGIVHCPVAAMK